MFVIKDRLKLPETFRNLEKLNCMLQCSEIWFPLSKPFSNDESCGWKTTDFLRGKDKKTMKIKIITKNPSQPFPNLQDNCAKFPTSISQGGNCRTGSFFPLFSKMLGWRVSLGPALPQKVLFLSRVAKCGCYAEPCSGARGRSSILFPSLQRAGSCLGSRVRQNRSWSGRSGVDGRLLKSCCHALFCAWKVSEQHQCPIAGPVLLDSRAGQTKSLLGWGWLTTKKKGLVAMGGKRRPFVEGKILYDICRGFSSFFKTNSPKHSCSFSLLPEELKDQCKSKIRKGQPARTSKPGPYHLLPQGHREVFHQFPRKQDCTVGPCCSVPWHALSMMTTRPGPGFPACISPHECTLLLDGPGGLLARTSG